MSSSAVDRNTSLPRTASRSVSMERRQRFQPYGDEQLFARVDPQCRDFGRCHIEIEHHVVDDGEQRAFLMFDTRGMRALSERLEEGVGQIELRAHPAFARAVCKVEVQSDEVVSVMAGIALRRP